MNDVRMEPNGIKPHTTKKRASTAILWLRGGGIETHTQYHTAVGVRMYVGRSPEVAVLLEQILCVFCHGTLRSVRHIFERIYVTYDTSIVVDKNGKYCSTYAGVTCDVEGRRSIAKLERQSTTPSACIMIRKEVGSKGFP